MSSQLTYEGCGYLELEDFTPVIESLFAVYHPDPDSFNKGRINIIRKPGIVPEWNDVYQHLVNQAKIWGWNLDNIDSIQKILYLYAEFYISKNPVFEITHRMNENFKMQLSQIDFGCMVELDCLYLLAYYFDDGHSLRNITFEGVSSIQDQQCCIHRGGDSLFVSSNFASYVSTDKVLEDAKEIDCLLAHKNIDGVVTLIADNFDAYLDGITDRQVRHKVREMVALLLP